MSFSEIQIRQASGMGSSLVAPTQHSASSVAAIVAALSNLDLNVSSGNGKVSLGYSYWRCNTKLMSACVSSGELA